VRSEPAGASDHFIDDSSQTRAAGEFNVWRVVVVDDVSTTDKTLVDKARIEDVAKYRVQLLAAVARFLTA